MERKGRACPSTLARCAQPSPVGWMGAGCGVSISSLERAWPEYSLAFKFQLYSVHTLQSQLTAHAHPECHAKLLS